MGEWGSMRWRWAPEAMEGGSPTQRAVCLPGVSIVCTLDWLAAGSGAHSVGRYQYKLDWVSGIRFGRFSLRDGGRC